MKRFTETTKWDDPWFWELSTPAKLLYLFLLDHCDNAGVINCNLKLASLKIGEPVDSKTISELGDRLQVLKGGKLYLVKFVRFQYGALKPTSNLHASVLELLNRHGISISPTVALVKPSGSPQVALLGPITPTDDGSKYSTVQYSKGTGNEKVAEKTKLEILREALNGLYNRGPDDHWSYSEETALVDVFKRPKCLDEIAELRNYERSTTYFPRTVVSLLSEWGKHLDAARTATRNGQKEAKTKPKTIRDKELDSIEREIKKIENDYS
jgi:hypothetical protein